MDVRAMTDDELQALAVELEAERAAVRERAAAVRREISRRSVDAKLARLAEGYTAEQLARLQEIKAAGVASAEAFGVPGRN